MTRDEFDLALRHLQSNDPPLILPYCLAPGAKPGGAVPTFTEKTWKKYRWNPPGTTNYNGQPVDTAASAKPTWAMLQAALAPAKLAQARDAALAELDDLCQKKIIAAYGVTNLQEEILKRLRNAETPAMNTENHRLRMLHTTQETAINSATTPAAVETLIVAARADAFWAPLPTDPAPQRGSG